MNETEQAKTLKPPAKPGVEELADLPVVQAATFLPRRLKVITGTSRGMYLADADTGEDLRLPIMSINVEPGGTQPNVHVTFHVVGVGPK